MTSRAKNLCLLMGLAASPALAAGTPDNLIFSLTGEDLDGLAQGLVQQYLSEPLDGHTDERFTETSGPFTYGIDGATYHAVIERVDLTPRRGQVHALVTLRDVRIKADKVFFNETESLYCSGMPFDATSRPVPVGGEISAATNGGHLQLAFSGVQVALDGRSFEPGQPDSCHTVPGLDWLVRRVVPVATRLMRASLEQTLARRIEQALAKLPTDLTDALTAEITLPFDLQPAPKFYATFKIWPDALTITPERLNFTLGAAVTFDPDQPARKVRRRPAILAAAEGLRADSYFGISRGLIETTLNSANQAGLFKVRIDGDTLAPAANILLASKLSAFLPDAATRFDQLAPVGLRLKGASGIGAKVLPCGPGGIPIIEIIVNGLDVGVEVAGQPYYDMRVRMHLKLAAGLKGDDQRVVLEIAHLATALVDGGFVPGLTPAPVDSSFDRNAFAGFIHEIDQRLTAGAGKLLSVALPDVQIGDRILDFVGSSTREDEYVTLDAQTRVAQ
jgi:hypothetical protein